MHIYLIDWFKCFDLLCFHQVQCLNIYVLIFDVHSHMIYLNWIAFRFGFGWNIYFGLCSIFKFILIILSVVSGILEMLFLWMFSISLLIWWQSHYWAYISFKDFMSCCNSLRFIIWRCNLFNFGNIVLRIYGLFKTK